MSSPRYWARELQLTASTEHGAALRRRVLWVKRKTGHLGYGADPQGLSSIFCRPFETRAPLSRADGGGSSSGRSELLHAFCHEPSLLAFSRYLCEEQPPLSPLGGAPQPLSALGLPLRRDELHRFCSAVLFECLTQVRPNPNPSPSPNPNPKPDPNH